MFYIDIYDKDGAYCGWLNAEGGIATDEENRAQYETAEDAEHARAQFVAANPEAYREHHSEVVEEDEIIEDDDSEFDEDEDDNEEGEKE